MEFESFYVTSLEMKQKTRTNNYKNLWILYLLPDISKVHRLQLGLMLSFSILLAHRL